MNYDCSPTPKHENVVHHASRVIHNLFHPHHHIDFAPPLVLACHEPDLDTITITADHDVPVFTPPGTADTGGAYYSPPGLYTDEPTPIGYLESSPGLALVGNSHPVAVPEPDVWVSMLPLTVITFVIIRLKARSKQP